MGFFTKMNMDDGVSEIYGFQICFSAIVTNMGYSLRDESELL